MSRTKMKPMDYLLIGGILGAAGLLAYIGSRVASEWKQLSHELDHAGVLPPGR